MGKVFSGILVSVIGISVALWLLYIEKFTGTEFVALTLGFAFIGLIISFSSEVQEFSIVGNAVKLRELRSEASKTIDELKQARTEVFRLLIQKSINFSGGFGSNSKIDERIKSFCHLYEQIEKFDCILEIKEDIQKSLKVLLYCQYQNLILIHESSISVNYNFDELDLPQTLFVKLNDEMINNLIKGKQPEPNFYDIKKDVIEAIDAYGKLYVIQTELNRL